MKITLYLSMLSLILSLSACRSEQAEQATEKRVIVLGNTPEERPYSPAVEVGNTLYVSGQVAIDPSTNEIVEGAGTTNTDKP